MMKFLNKKILSTIISILVFIIFCYIMIVINLHKATKVTEINILKSKALKEFIIFSLIILPFIFIIKKIIENKQKKDTVNSVVLLQHSLDSRKLLVSENVLYLLLHQTNYQPRFSTYTVLHI